MPADHRIKPSRAEPQSGWLVGWLAVRRLRGRYDKGWMKSDMAVTDLSSACSAIATQQAAVMCVCVGEREKEPAAWKGDTGFSGTRPFAEHSQPRYNGCDRLRKKELV